MIQNYFYHKAIFEKLCEEIKDRGYLVTENKYDLLKFKTPNGTLRILNFNRKSSKEIIINFYSKEKLPEISLANSLYFRFLCKLKRLPKITFPRLPHTISVYSKDKKLCSEFLTKERVNLLKMLDKESVKFGLNINKKGFDLTLPAMQRHKISIFIRSKISNKDSGYIKLRNKVEFALNFSQDPE